jgi:hypothetical protein
MSATGSASAAEIVMFSALAEPVAHFFNRLLGHDNEKALEIS